MTIQNKTIKSLIAAAAVGAALTGLSANAQPRPYDNRGPMARPDAHFNRADQISDRISNLRERIDQGQRMRRLSFREATRLSTRLNEIASLKRTYERSGRGLDNREIATLNVRLDTLSGQVKYQGHDGNRG